MFLNFLMNVYVYIIYVDDFIMLYLWNLFGTFIVIHLLNTYLVHAIVLLKPKFHYLLIIKTLTHTSLKALAFFKRISHVLFIEMLPTHYLFVLPVAEHSLNNSSNTPTYNIRLQRNRHVTDIITNSIIIETIFNAEL